MLYECITGGFPIFMPVQLALQIICLRKYPAIERLRAQEGYPDFNTIFTNDRYTKRLYSDEAVRESMKSAEASMDALETNGICADISELSDHDGKADKKIGMDEI